MIAIVSPSKTMKEESVNIETTEPYFIKETKILKNELKNYSKENLKDLMKISDNLADLNYKRFQNFDKAESYPAIYLFRGDVFNGISQDSLNEDELEYLNKHLVILSGLYGAIRPLDSIKPYRLEMGTKLKNKYGDNLYEFWGDKVKKYLEKESQDKILINLASKEYSKVIKEKEINLDVYDIDFKELREKKYKIIAFYAKVARGEMARFMAANNCQVVDDLKKFNYSGYKFNEKLSSEKNLVFTREQVKAKNIKK